MRAVGASHNFLLLDNASPVCWQRSLGARKVARCRGFQKRTQINFALILKIGPSAPEVCLFFFFLNPAPRGKRHLATVSRIREQRFPLLHDCCAQDPSGCWRVGAAWVFPAGPEGDLASLQWGVSRQLRESGWWWLGTGLGDW